MEIQGDRPVTARCILLQLTVPVRLNMSEKLPIFAELGKNAQIDVHNSDATVRGVARSGVPRSEAEELQRARNETREHPLACIDTVSQDSENG